MIFKPISLVLAVWAIGVQAATCSSSSSASPSATIGPVPACAASSFPVSRLYARNSKGVSYPVRLESNGNDTYSTIVNTNLTCTDCGVGPISWLLSNKLLSATLPSSSTTAGASVINLAVPAASSPSFIKVKAASAKYPIYCASNSGSSIGAVLSVNGVSDSFTMCAWTSIVPYPTKFDIVYKRSSIQPVGVSCFPVTLVLESLIVVDTPPPVTVL